MLTDPESDDEKVLTKIFSNDLKNHEVLYIQSKVNII